MTYLEAVRVVGALALHLRALPAGHCYVRWQTAGAWGLAANFVSVPASFPNREAWEAWADGVAGWAGTRAGIEGLTNVEAVGKSGFKAFEVCSYDRPTGNGATRRVAHAAVADAVGAPAQLVHRVRPAFEDADPGAAPPFYDPLCRGLVEGLFRAMSEERAALGAHYAPLRAVLDALFEEARPQDRTASQRVEARAVLFDALDARRLDAQDRTPSAALWYVALTENLRRVLTTAARAEPGDAWPYPPEVQSLVSCIALGRAHRTEDVEEAWAWAEECLRDGRSMYDDRLPLGMSRLGRYLRGR